MAGRNSLPWMSVAIGCLVFLALPGVFSGCSGGGPGGSSLTDRAKQYLELKQKHEWARIYDDLLDPQARPGLPKDAFLKRREVPFDVLSFELVSADSQGTEGKVVAKLEAVIPVLNPRGGTQTIQKKVDDVQRWVQRDGQWFIDLES